MSCLFPGRGEGRGEGGKKKKSRSRVEEVGLLAMTGFMRLILFFFLFQVYISSFSLILYSTDLYLQHRTFISPLRLESLVKFQGLSPILLSLMASLQNRESFFLTMSLMPDAVRNTLTNFKTESN